MAEPQPAYAPVPGVPAGELVGDPGEEAVEAAAAPAEHGPLDHAAPSEQAAPPAAAQHGHRGPNLDPNLVWTTVACLAASLLGSTSWFRARAAGNRCG